MIESTLDIWSIDRFRSNSWIGITTNATINSSNHIVMGRGVAYQAKSRYPMLPQILSNHVSHNGNTICFIPDFKIFSFPVKHNWWEKADLDLIKSSADQLYRIISIFSMHTFYLPCPGCGNGNLSWGMVKPIISFLPDNVICVSK